MARIGVIDSSVVIGLVEAETLTICANMFDEILMPIRVWDELGAKLHAPEAAAVGALTNVRLLPDAEEAPETATLGAGERQVIAVARLHANALALLDDRAARVVARTLGIPFKGTLGVLVEAKRKSLIPALAPLCERLLQRGFRLSPTLVDEVLRTVGER